VRPESAGCSLYDAAEIGEIACFDGPAKLGGKIFCTAAPDGSTITVKADPVEREALLGGGDPYFVPAYVGEMGWLGIDLGGRETHWDEVA
jgi:hypothetical protein